MPATTQRPTVSNKCNIIPGNILTDLSPSPIEFLNRVLQQYPFLELIPNSLLGQAVIAQYNQHTAPTTERPPWPAPLCGYIEAIQDRALRDGRGDRSDVLPRNQITSNINGIPDTKYDQDDCIQPTVRITTELGRLDTPIDTQLAVRQPGTLAYSRDCETPNLIQDIYDVDWTGYFKTSVYPDVDSLTDEEKEAYEEAFGPILQGLGYESQDEFRQALVDAKESASGGGTGDNQFLWKPVSESTGNLVILLPNSTFTNNPSRSNNRNGYGLRVYITKSNTRLNPGDSSIIGNEGTWHTNTHNGNREHYRFSKPGASYPNNVYVFAELFNPGRGGETNPYFVWRWPIVDSSARNTPDGELRLKTSNARISGGNPANNNPDFEPDTN